MRFDPTSRIRILLLIPHLGTGGAQHVTATLARHLDPNKYEVHLALLTQSASTGALFPDAIRIHCLGGKRARLSVLSLLALVRHVHPQVIFIGMAHLVPLILLLRAMLPAQTRIIVRQNGSLSSLFDAIRPLPRSILSLAYKRADAIICQTQFRADEVQQEFHLPRARVHVLPNPIDPRSIRQADSFSSQKRDPYLLAVGRLVPEKGFDLLLDAFALLQKDFPTLRLLIAGSGRCRTALEFQASLLGLRSDVEFLGDVRDPSQYFCDALAFVLCSREDELPNALLEAAASGLPIVATPASPGISSLLAGQHGVWLTHDASAVALEQSLRIGLTAIQPSQRFAHDWIQPFALAPAIAAYERVFEQAVSGDRH